jgi:hypothetical protein
MKQMYFIYSCDMAVTNCVRLYKRLQSDIHVVLLLCVECIQENVFLGITRCTVACCNCCVMLTSGRFLWFHVRTNLTLL